MSFLRADMLADGRDNSLSSLISKDGDAGLKKGETRRWNPKPGIDPERMVANGVVRSERDVPTVGAGEAKEADKG